MKTFAQSIWVNVRQVGHKPMAVYGESLSIPYSMPALCVENRLSACEGPK